MKKCYIIGFLILTMINIATIVGGYIVLDKKEQYISNLNERIYDVQRTCYFYEMEINELYNELEKSN